MKKFFIYGALAISGFASLISCDNSTTDPSGYTDNDTYSQIKDVTGTLDPAKNYALDQGLSIQSTDVVLVYRNVNSNVSGSSPVWQLLPKTYSLDNVSVTSAGRELDYNFLFNTSKVQVYSEANFDQNTMSAAEKATYLTNQTFRIVLVPASGKNANLNYNDYNAVVKFYGLKEPK